MKNKLILLLLLVFVPFIQMMAQNEEAKEELLTTMAKETCECGINKNLDFDAIDSNKLQIELGLCILESYSNHKSEVDALYGLELDNENSMEYFGEQIGMKMVAHCPDFLINIAEGSHLMDDQKIESSVITGKILNIEKNQFNVIEFKDNTNRIHKLLWLEYFEGEHLLRSDFNNVTFQVSYYESEMYDPVIMEYRNYKVITQLSIL